MKRALLILALAVACAGYAQTDSRIDSLQQAAREQSSVEKAETLVQLSESFRELSFDESLQCIQEAVAIARAEGNQQVEAEALNSEGETFLANYDLDLAKDCFESAFNVYESIGDVEKASLMADNIGFVARIMGLNDEALHYLQYSFDVCDSLGLYSAAAISLNDLGAVYYAVGDVDMSMNSFQRAKLYFEADGDSLSMAECDNNMSVLYSELGEYEEAERILESIIPYLKSVGDQTTLANAYHNLGLVYAGFHNDDDKALALLEEALPLRIETADSIAICQCKVEMSKILLKKDKLNEAITNLTSALNTAVATGYAEGMIVANTVLGDAYCKMGMTQKSLDCFMEARRVSENFDNWEYDMLINRGLIVDYAAIHDMDALEKEMDVLFTDYNDVERQFRKLIMETNREKYAFEDLETRISVLETQLEQSSIDQRNRKLTFVAITVMEMLVFLMIIAVIKRKNNG